MTGPKGPENRASGVGPMIAPEIGMTDFSAADIGIQHRPGKHNLASAAFEELRTARREGRAPEGGQVSFGDLIDTLNPLQHIPVVSEAYRSMTGDGISPQARIAGGALWGGPGGLVASVASLAIGGNGEDGIGDRIYASLFGESGDAEVTLAAAETPAKAAQETNDKLVTASVATPAIPAKPAPQAPQMKTPAAMPESEKPLPRMSPAAFQALVGSFAAPSRPDGGAGEASAESAGPRTDLASAMLDALDKYEAMKTVSPGN